MKRTAKFFTSVVVVAPLLAPCQVWAQACRALEYAELKDMTREQLLREYCNAQLGKITNTEGWKREAVEGRVREAHRYSDALSKCRAEEERLERILETRFALKQPSCAGVPP